MRFTSSSKDFSALFDRRAGPTRRCSVHSAHPQRRHESGIGVRSGRCRCGVRPYCGFWSDRDLRLAAGAHFLAPLDQRPFSAVLGPHHTSGETAQSAGGNKKRRFIHRLQFDLFINSDQSDDDLVVCRHFRRTQRRYAQGSFVTAAVSFAGVFSGSLLWRLLLSGAPAC